MKIATATATAPSFTLEPTIPFLRTDAKMQQAEAFVGMRTIELNKAGWAPMSVYFPGGAILAAVQIHKMEDLTPGVYWYETTHPAEGGSKISTSYNFGRFEGFGELSPAQARRYKKGEAHIELGADTLDCNLGQHGLREDGTVTCYVDFESNNYHGYQRRIWRITHYVDLPASAVMSLAGPNDENYARAASIWAATGLTEDQERWLVEEKNLSTKESCSEYSACIVGAFPELKHRAVLLGEVNGCFGQLFGHTPTITASQAKKRKSGAVAITWRTYRNDGKIIGYTQHYKLEDASIMLDYLQGRAEVDRAASRLSAITSALLEASSDIDAKLEEEIIVEAREPVEQPEPRYHLVAA